MNPGMDPLRRSRQIQIIRDYVNDGWLGPAALKGLAQATEAELETLIERGRERRAEAEGEGTAEEPTTPVVEGSPEAPAEAPPVNTRQPEPSRPLLASEPQPAEQEGPPSMPEGENLMTEQEFKDKYPVGTHVRFDGDEFVVAKHFAAGNEAGPYMQCIPIVGETMEITLQEEHDEEVEPHPEPTKIPQKTEYPPQVFILAWADKDGQPGAGVYKDMGTLKEADPDIDGDAIMEAISDPGEAQDIGGGRTLTFASIS